jgi:aryl-alcohol dehydrogenase-like predicted oxidoreductase
LIFVAVDVGVKNLSTYLDVLQIHRLDGDTPQEEIMKALNNVVESGKGAILCEFCVLPSPFPSAVLYKMFCV